MPNLLTALRAHLVAQDIVRVPKVAGTVPPMWLAPKLGTPAPGERPPNGSDAEVGPDAVVGAFVTGGFAPAPYGKPIRKPIVDLRLRTANALIAENLELAITNALIDQRDFMLDDLYVIECEQWNALALIGSDEQGFDYRVSYWFEIPRA